MTRMIQISLAALMAGTAAAAASANPSEWNRPYGDTHGTENRPYHGMRDPNNNRVVVNGLIQTGVGVSASAGATASATAGGVGNGQGGLNASSATAIGNQLNVIVNGRNNTVVVNSQQTNNGDVSANSGANQAPPSPSTPE